ncbi:head maturation protease, ClpP-related [Xylocopilactobacillus apis]|uniref:ATP-dependent Clp protease proteolytic subunit n=1 Tax=Xylocopilactobacillus apis TaxID=2932183 RepID=A0AAU9DMK5_9LACO|nr:head maturation protease, ClpP-related [Xylocopilactobacillus apis]BDR56884.1 ATP-dependent Clp protease proteolytic subunit [Xylocopilactobacillus apis]
MTEINIKGDVVDSNSSSFYEFFGMSYISPNVVEDTLANATDDITLNVASNGGDVFAASEIYTLLKNYSGGKITAKIQGLAASAASVIAMAADNVEISPTAQIMIHKASVYGVDYGNADDFQHQAEVLDGIDQSIVNAYVSKTGMDEGKILNMMTKETWLTAQQAVDYGFADSIMFVDDKQPVFTNSTERLVNPVVINRFKTLMAQAQKYQELIQNEEPEKPQDKKECRLFDEKLAILLHKNGGAE